MRDLLELRDEYKHVMAPGLGNQATAAGVYAHAIRALQILETVAGPEEVFAAISSLDGEYGEED